MLSCAERKRLALFVCCDANKTIATTILHECRDCHSMSEVLTASAVDFHVSCTIGFILVTVNAWPHASEECSYSLRLKPGEELLSDLDTEDVGETGTYAHRRVFLDAVIVVHVCMDIHREILVSPNGQVVVALLWCLIDNEWLVVVVLEVTVSEGVLTLEDFVVILSILRTNTRALIGEKGLEFNAWVQLDRF